MDLPGEAAAGAMSAGEGDGGAILRELVGRIDAALLPVSDPVPSTASREETSLEEAPLTVESPASGASPVESVEGVGELYVFFELGGSFFAAPAANLIEVEVFEKPMPIPGVPPWVLGIRSFRGEVVSIVDLAAFLGFAKLVPTEHARTLVVSDPGRKNQALTGLAVDAVLTHQWLPKGSAGEQAAKALGGRLGQFALRIVELEGRALAELDLESLLDSADFRQLSD